ncbi:MAG: transposase [Candidatus Hydrothermarchaeales archaeon]
MAKRNRNPHYWKIYHSSGISDPIRIINLVKGIVRKLGPPWQVSKRGRPPEIAPQLHASICITLACFGATLREMEGLTEPFFKRRVDHSTIDWAMQKLPPDFILQAIKALHEKIDRQCGKGVFIADSTGISTDRYGACKKGTEEAEKKEHRKLHVIVKHYPEDAIISIVGAGESHGDRHDSPAFREIFDPTHCRNGLLFADRAYDAEPNHRKCYDNDLVPIIKQKVYDKRPKRHRRKALMDFDEELYKRHRGLVEGVFGGLETRYDNRTRYRKEHTRKVGILMMALAHNIRAYLRAVAMSGVYGFHGVVSFFRGILRQPRPRS